MRTVRFGVTQIGRRQAFARVRVGIAEEEQSPTSSCGNFTAVGGAGNQQVGNVLWIKIQLHELERDLDQERHKNQGGLELEALWAMTEEDRTGVEEECWRDRRETEEIEIREEDRVRDIEEVEGKRRRSESSRND